MIPGLIGKKLGMTRVFDSKGNVIPVTLVEMGPCTVVKIKQTSGKDGYDSIQMGYQPIRMSRLNKPSAGHFKKAGFKDGFKVLKEFRVDGTDDVKVGDVITAEQIFKEDTRVKVIGTSIGRGFAGAMKRHGFHGAEASHGAEKVHRRPMSAGSTDAARVFKGKRGPGHMGNAQVTYKNIEIVKIKAIGEELISNDEDKIEKNLDVVEQKDDVNTENVVEENTEVKEEAKKEKKEETARPGKFIVALKGSVPGKKNSLVVLENI